MHEVSRPYTVNEVAELTGFSPQTDLTSPRSWSTTRVRGGKLVQFLFRNDELCCTTM
jgi:hypothetical protein